MFQRLMPSNFTFGGNLPSSYMNALDGYLPDMLDKRGDTILGPISVETLGNFSFEDGSFIELQDEAQLILDDGANIVVESGGTATVIPSSSTQGVLDFSSLIALVIRGPSSIETTGSLTMKGTANVLLASRSITRLTHGSVAFDPAKWLPAISTNDRGTLESSDVTLGIPLWVELDVPHGATLTSVSVNIAPQNGHSALPSAMPVLKVYSRTPANVQTTLGSFTDTSSNVTNYETPHALTVGSLSTAVNRVTTRYFAELQAECTSNSVSGMRYISTSWTATVTQYDEG